MLLDCQVNLTAVMDATNELLLSLRNPNDARLAPATYVMHVAVMREFLHIDDDTDGLEQFFDTLTIAAQPCQRPVEQVHPDVHDIAMTAAADMVVGNTTLAGYRRSVETSIDRAANAKVHATGSITPALTRNDTNRQINLSKWLMKHLKYPSRRLLRQPLLERWIQ